MGGKCAARSIQVLGSRVLRGAHSREEDSMTCPECYASDVATSEKEIRDEEACYREMVVVYACCKCGCKSTEPSDWSDPDWDDAEVMIIADAVASLKPAKESEDLIEMLRRNPDIPAELVREMARAEGRLHGR